MAASVPTLHGTSSAVPQSQVGMGTTGKKTPSKGDGGGEGPAGEKAGDSGITMVS